MSLHGCSPTFPVALLHKARLFSVVDLGFLKGVSDNFYYYVGLQKQH